MTEATEEMGGPPPLFDIGATLKVLWARRLLILGVAFAVLMAAAAYIAVTKPVYTATATILLDPRDSHATGFDSVLPGIGADSAAIASQVSVIESTDLLSAVFDAENIKDDPEFSGRGLLSRLLGRSGPSRAAIFDRFRGKVSVEREGLTYVIDVSFKSSDKDKAARIVNAIVDRYKASLAGEKETANSEANTLLTEKIGGLENAVSDADKAVQDFKFQHQIFDANAGGTLQSQIDQFSAQLVSAQDQADQAQAKYDQAMAAGSGPDGLSRLSEILNSNTTDKLRDDYNQRAAALANSEVVLGPKHPTVARLGGELARIRGLMAAEASRITQELKAQRDIAVKNVAQLRAKLAALRDEGNQSDLAQVQLRQLQRKADAARSVLEDFLKRSQETEHLEGMQISQVRVISAAAPPIQPTWPRPALLLPVAAALGLMLGCALALLLGSRQTPKAGLLGRMIPLRTRLLPKRFFQAAPAAARSGGIADLGAIRLPVADGTPLGSVKAIRAEMRRFGNAPFLEQVQELLVAITDRLVPHAKPFILVISSIGNGPERSMAAALVGIGLDHIRQKILVVDVVDSTRASHASPGLHGAPFIDPASGLRTIVASSGMMTAHAAPGADGAIERLLARSGTPADFIVVIGRPLTEPGYSHAVAARADLNVFALRPSERNSGASAWLDGRIASAQLAKSVTMTIGGGAETRTAAAPERSRPIAANSEERRGMAAARR